MAMPIYYRAPLLAFALWSALLDFHAQRPKTAKASALNLKKEIESFAPLQGKWTCQGVFPSSGKKIESQIAFAPDLDGAWLVKRHDDLAPNLFHDAEYWGYDSTAKQFVAFIYDNFGGVRKFTSSGWADDKLTWLGEPSKSDPPRLERFVYKRDSPTQIEVNWEIKKGTADWAIGDTLTCKK
jgi:hypothetical protein